MKTNCVANQEMFVVHFKNAHVDMFSPTLEELYHNFLCQFYLAAKVDPISIQLPNGVNLPYNSYVFHQCFDHGSISEKELIEILLNKQEG